MKANRSSQMALLKVQRIDARLAQIRHKLATLPEQKTLDDAQTALKKLETLLVHLTTAVSDIQREITKAEADVEQVRSRAARDQARLDSGGVTSKEAQGLLHELDTLARRQSELEDVELEVMERAETLSAQAEAAAQAREKSQDEVQAATEKRDAATSVLTQESDALTEERGVLVTEVEEPLLALYNKLRAQSGPGAAEMRARRCGGCNLEILGLQWEQLKAAGPDDVFQCEECRCIVIRTPESGL